MTKASSALFVVLTAVFAIGAAGTSPAQMRGEFALTGEWRIQPAAGPDAAPDPAQWARCRIDQWVYPAGNGAVTAGWNEFWSFRLPEDGPVWARKMNEPNGRGGINRLWWQHDATVPPAWRGRRVLLDLERIDGDAIVFWNGRRLREVLMPSGEIDVSAVARYGEPNTVLIYLTRDYTGISRPFEQDLLRYAARGPEGRRVPPAEWPFGLTGKVSLCARPMDAAVTDLFVRTSWRRKELRIDAEVDAAKPLKDLLLHAEILDAQGKPVLTFEEPLAAIPQGVSTHTLTHSWPDAHLWELEKAYLYHARVAIRRGVAPIDISPDVAFGFREIWTEGNRLILNGHPIRFRLGWNANLSLGSFGLLRLVGLNVFEFQPNPTCFYDIWPTGWPLVDPDILNLLDREGCGALLMAPTVDHMKGRLLDDPRTEAAHAEMLRRWLRLYRNHPSVFAWIPSMNMVGSQSNIGADGMGKRSVRYHTTPDRVVEKACAMVKAMDPTRLVFGHAEGNIGDVSTSNVYLNFVPLQEREEWPSEHAAHGDMPYAAVEFGQPATLNYWKPMLGPRFLLTEYLAMYFGDRAYATEGEKALATVVETGVGNPAPNNSWARVDWNRVDVAQYPAFWELQALFIRQTDRAWRTWGVAGGWFYWDFDVGYGSAPKDRAAATPADRLMKPPAWVNRNFHIHRATMQPLLVYLAGSPRHTDKTHAFYAGETIRKQIAWVWDGPGNKTLHARWSVVPRPGGLPSASGDATVTLSPGAIRFSPIEFVAPSSNRKRGLALQLRVEDSGRVVQEDRLPLQVFPKLVRSALKSRVALYDPKNASGPWLKALGIAATPWTAGSDPGRFDVLILGREALTGATRLPFTEADIRRGLRVLILEQRPEAWEAMGLKSIETMPRYVFATRSRHPALAGLSAEDLIDWRGAPNLLPEKKWYRSYDFYHAPKWTNTHAVASTAIEIPQVGGFEPILSCEFDLNYSPLLEWRYGKGSILWSSLDLTGRVGSDPAATRLAADLLRYVAAPTSARDRDLWLIGGKADEKLLATLGFAPKQGMPSRPGGVLVLGSGGWTWADAEAYAREGGTVICLPQTAKVLTAGGYAVSESVVYKSDPIDHPLFDAVGPRLLRWRDGLKTALLSRERQPAASRRLGNGLFLYRPLGKGGVLLIQADPNGPAERYANDVERRKAVWMSVERLYQLYARILTNAGAPPSGAAARRLCTLKAGAAYEELNTWQVCGPFVYNNLPVEDAIKQTAPAEADAIKGDPHPDLRYFTPEGAERNWRTTVTAGAGGFVNLGAALRADQRALAYVTRKVESRSDRRARLRIGLDFFMMVYVNGELVCDLSGGGGVAPNPNTHKVDIALRRGENYITFKIAAGSGGFGFWADLSTETAGLAEGKAGNDSLDLYPVADRSWDPYAFYYY